MEETPGTRTRSLLTKTEGLIEHLSEALADFIVERESALALLKWHRAQVVELERKYEDLKVHIETTQSAKRKMEIVAKDLRYSLSPIKTAPTEILMRIFEITINNEVGACRSALSVGMSGIARPVTLILSQVCRHWREIVSNSPLLWSFLYFSVAISLSFHHLPLFHHYMSFGEPHQKSVVIPWAEKSAIKLFRNQTGRPLVPYKSLELVMTVNPFHTDGLLPDVLRSREVTIYRNPNVLNIQHMVPLLRVASTVTVYGTPAQWGDAPWASLETLILKDFCDAAQDGVGTYGFTRDDFIRLLDVTPSLRRLELDFRVNEATMAWDNRVAMSSASIKYLSVHAHHFGGSKGLFGVQLVLPALDTLEILSFSFRSPIPEDKKFIYKYLNPKRVVLREMNDADVTLVAHLLHQFPNATSLEMTGRNCNNLLRLAHSDYHSISPPSMPLPIPQVTTLRITDTDIQGDVLIRFVEMKLQHRKAGTLGVVCLEDIMMYTTPGVTVADWARVQTMLEAGREANGG